MKLVNTKRKYIKNKVIEVIIGSLIVCWNFIN